MFLLFDMDGVLLDTVPFWRHVGERYLQSFGIAAEPGLGRRLFPMTMQEGAQYLRTRYRLPLEEPQIIAGIDALAASFYRDTAPLKPGIAETLAELRHRGHECGIATGTDRGLAEAALRRTGIAEHFTRLFTCTELGTGKSNPAFYQRILAELHLALDDAVVIEDSLHAIETANAIGLATIAVYDAPSRDDWPRLQATATHACRTFPELLAFL